MSRKSTPTENDYILKNGNTLNINNMQKYKHMKTVISAYQKCPSAAEFEQYIKQTGSENFKTTFEDHLAECRLCAEALEGYKKSGINNITYFSANTTRKYNNQHTHHTFNLIQWSFAATIALLVGISTFYFYNKNNQTYQNLATPLDNELIASESVPLNGQKKLTKNLNEQYWYLGENNVIAVNDVIVAQEAIEQIIKNTEPVESIIVEIKNADFEYGNQLVITLKNIQKAPVYTL